MKIETIISADLQKSVRNIISNYADIERQDRLLRVMKALKNRSLVRGDRPDWWDDVTGSWLPFEKSPKYNAQDAPTYKFSPNLLDAVLGIFQGAIATTGIPGSEIVPQNRKQPMDVAVAKIGDAVRDYERTSINFRSLWLKNFRYQFTDGLCVFHIRHVRSAERYGYRDVEKIVTQNKTFRPAGYECQFCGWFGKETDPAAKSAVDTGVCPDCGLPVMEEDRQEAIKGTVPIKSIEQVEIGKELVDAYGLVETRLPFWAPSKERSPYAAIETLADRNAILAAFHELDGIEEAMGGLKTDDGTENNNDFARRMSLSPAGVPVEEAGRLPTYRRWWLRPESFYAEKDAGKRRELLTEYPNGGLFQLAGSTFLDARKEKLDDQLVVCRAQESDGMYPEALADNGVPIHESVRIAYNMKMEAAEFASFPPVLVDKGVLSKTISKIRMRAAQLLFLEVPAGKMLKDSYHQMVVKESSQVLESLLSEAFTWLAFLVGTEAAMRGAASKNTRTKGGYELQANQATQRLAPAYQAAAISFAEIEERLIHQCVANRSPEELAEIVGQTMNEVPPEVLSDSLDISKGRIFARAEDSEAIPATWTQQISAWNALFASNNPAAQAWLNDPENAKLAVRAIGIKGFVIPGAAASERMDRLIPLMLAGKPAIFNPTMNNAALDLKLIQDWAATDEGLDAQMNNVQGFAIVEQYAQAAADQVAQTMAAANPQKPPPAPPPKADPEELQSKESIEKMKVEAQITVAEIGATAQQESTRSQLEADMFKQLRGSELELQQQDKEHEHAKTMLKLQPKPATKPSSKSPTRA